MEGRDKAVEEMLGQIRDAVEIVKTLEIDEDQENQDGIINDNLQ